MLIKLHVLVKLRYMLKSACVYVLRRVRFSIGCWGLWNLDTRDTDGSQLTMSKSLLLSLIYHISIFDQTPNDNH